MNYNRSDVLSFLDRNKFTPIVNFSQSTVYTNQNSTIHFTFYKDMSRMIDITYMGDDGKQVAKSYISPLAMCGSLKFDEIYHLSILRLMHEILQKSRLYIGCVIKKSKFLFLGEVDFTSHLKKSNMPGFYIHINKDGVVNISKWNYHRHGHSCLELVRNVVFPLEILHWNNELYKDAKRLVKYANNCI